MGFDFLPGRESLILCGSCDETKESAIMNETAAYVWNTEIVCPDCMFTVAKTRVLELGSATMWSDCYGRVDEVLGEWASLEGIDTSEPQDTSCYPSPILSEAEDLYDMNATPNDYGEWPARRCDMCHEPLAD